MWKGTYIKQDHWHLFEYFLIRIIFKYQNLLYFQHINDKYTEFWLVDIIQNIMLEIFFSM